MYWDPDVVLIWLITIMIRNMDCIDGKQTLSALPVRVSTAFELN